MNNTVLIYMGMISVIWYRVINFSMLTFPINFHFYYPKILLTIHVIEVCQVLSLRIKKLFVSQVVSVKQEDGESRSHSYI